MTRDELYQSLAAVWLKTRRRANPELRSLKRRGSLRKWMV